MEAGCSCGARGCLSLAEPPRQQQVALVFKTLCRNCNRLQLHNSQTLELSTRQERISGGVFDGDWISTVLDLLTCLFNSIRYKQYSTSRMEQGQPFIPAETFRRLRRTVAAAGRQVLDFYLLCESLPQRAHRNWSTQGTMIQLSVTITQLLF